MRYFILSLVLVLCNCTCPNKMQNSTITPSYHDEAHVVVYKTRGNYINNVPITLSEDRKSVLSYPDPSDLKVGNEFTMPTPLKDGYLLDRRGVSRNSVFLKLNYTEYANLKKAPSRDELFSIIMDETPFIELIDCGDRSAYKNLLADINLLITTKQLRKKCKIII